MKTHFRIAAIIACICLFNVSYSQNWTVTGNTLAATGLLGSSNNFDVKFITNGVDRMIIKKNGFIGIGTNKPAVALHLYGAMQIENNNTINYDDPLLVLRSSAANGTATNPVIAFKVEDTTYAIMGYDVSTKDMVFSTQSAGLTPDLIINHVNGFTGLNTKTPAYRLDVNGTSRFQGNVGIQTIPGANTLQIGSVTGSVVGIGTAEKISDGGSNQLAFLGTLRPWTDATYSIGSSTYRWYNVWATNGTIQTSDARDKTNIRELNYGINEIMKLAPVRFDWKAKPEEGDKIGLIAQDIEKVLPEVVRNWDYVTDEKTGKQTKVGVDRLGVMYADIIPVLIRGMQDQQKQIEALKQQVSQVTAISQTSTTATDNIVLSNTSIEQNIPNPVKNFTSIRYYIASKGNAQLKITNDNGDVLKTVKLNATGKGSANVDCSSLSAGTYYYSLMIDGKILDTKKMVVAK